MTRHSTWNPQTEISKLLRGCLIFLLQPMKIDIASCVVVVHSPIPSTRNLVLSFHPRSLSHSLSLSQSHPIHLIPINNPQTPPRRQHSPPKRRRRAPQQILPTRIATTASQTRICPTATTTAILPLPTPIAAAHAAAPPAPRRAVITARLDALASSIAAALRARLVQQAGDRGTFFAARGRLRHLDVALVELQPFAVQPEAEEQIADQDEQEARDHAGDNSRDVRSAATAVAATACAGCTAAGARGAGLGDGGAVGLGHGVGDCLSGCEGPAGGCLGWSRDGCAASGAAADDGDDGFRDGVAVGAFEAAGVAFVG
ncbi:hypothetical protein M8818_004707 [Zalaria obscura]|uniref:Uncharacterized protein n=1 Tax=Zalaria obscura TaxID=2024903 RepID=A0ACC3SBW9_9PEZI